MRTSFLAVVLCAPLAFAADGGTPPPPDAGVTGGDAARKPPPPITFSMPTPEGWRTETIAFPLGFAPELPYRGLEELRFAPGMFAAGAEDFWSYAFVWWLEGEPPLSTAALQKDLKGYFEGLARAVEGKNHVPARARTTVSLTEQGAHRAVRTFEGTVRTYDPFKTHAPLTLNVRLDVLRCPSERRTVVFFQGSPQPVGHAVWQTLKSIRRGFACARSGGG